MVDMLRPLMLMFLMVVPGLLFLRDHVHVQVLVRMRMLMVSVQVFVNFNLPARQSDERGYSNQHQQSTGAEFKRILPGNRQQHASEISCDPRHRDYDGMRARKSHCEPDHAPKIMFHRHPKCRDGGKVVRADSVEQSGSENGGQEQHDDRLDSSSRITPAL